MNICSLCSRVREHVFAEHMFAHVRGEHMFAGGRFGKIIIRSFLAQAFECCSSSIYETVERPKTQLGLALGFPALESLRLCNCQTNKTTNWPGASVSSS